MNDIGSVHNDWYRNEINSRILSLRLPALARNSVWAQSFLFHLTRQWMGSTELSDWKESANSWSSLSSILHVSQVSKPDLRENLPESGRVILPPVCVTLAHARHSGSMLLGNWPRNDECLLTEYIDCGRESSIEILEHRFGRRSDDVLAVSPDCASRSNDLFVFIALSRYIGIFSIEPMWLLFGGVDDELFLIVCVKSGCCCTERTLTENETETSGKRRNNVN